MKIIRRLKQVIQEKRIKRIESKISSIISTIGIKYKSMNSDEANHMLDELYKSQDLLKKEKAVLESILNQ